MKKLLLASAIAALSVSAAQAAPTVYGKAFLTVDASSVETEKFGEKDKVEKTTSGLNSNSSRIGLKGSEALTANTDVVYKLEYGIDIDANDAKGKGQFYSRDTYLGLSNAEYGTLLAGRLTAIDDNVDFASVLEGGNVADITPTFNEPRANNAFAYVSPNYNGMTFMAMYGIDSDADAGGIDNEDQYGIAAKYSTGPMNVGASYINHGDDNHARISGNYVVTPQATVGILYQMSEFGVAAKKDKASPFVPVGDKKENTLIVSGEMATATPWSYYAQVALIDNVKGVDNSESMGIGGGAKYAFNKAATGHLYAGYVNSESGTKADKNLEETDGFGIGGGLEYKF